MELTQHPLGATGMQVAPLALGTVNLGRNAGLKYPRSAPIPTDGEARTLLQCAHKLGINLLDTAPAYGNSESRLGELLRADRGHWLICTKVGEEFDGKASRFDFTPEAVAHSVTRSLARLQMDVLDIVLIHSDGADETILDELGTLDALKDLKQKGLIRAVGISHKSSAGALRALDRNVDVIMATLNRSYVDEANLIGQAARQGCGVLIKKAMDSGHGGSEDLQFVAQQPGVHSIVVGTTNPVHLTENADTVATAFTSA